MIFAVVDVRTSSHIDVVLFCVSVFSFMNGVFVFVRFGRVKPPVVPKVHFDGDTSNFDEYPETDWKAARLLDEIELQLFDNF